MKQVEITFKESELSIDGQSLPGGEYHIREYVDGMLMGGCYATKLNLIENLELFFEDEENDQLYREAKLQWH